MKLANTSWVAILLALASPWMMALSAGDAAPSFTSKNQNGKLVQLSDFKGKFLLIYFYPKDETPGCTKEACSFRDGYAKLKKLNAAVIGVSVQDSESHQKFIANHKLPFDLLADTDGKLAKSFGVETMPIIGLEKRQSILIGPTGKVVHFYGDVDPDKHLDEVLADIQKASAT